jgi:hypothetical protein
MAGPLRGARAGDPGAPTINVKKHRRQDPLVLLELEIRKRPPSTLRVVDGGPLGDARAVDLGAPNLNDKKCVLRAPWEVSEL